MKPYYQDFAVTLFCGDALSTLQGLPTASVHCCVTSPPYFSLRDYQIAGQIGLEKKPDCLGWATGAPCGSCYVCKLVAVFREVRRVLRMDGTLWLNCGDSYNSNTHWSGGADSAVCGNTKRVTNGATRRMQLPGLKPKDLMLIPSRVALALQADGWYLRSDIAWCKKAPMPESVKDRPTSAHEHIFLFSKSPRYFYDAEAVREIKAPATLADSRTNANGHRRDRDFIGSPSNGGTNLGGPSGDRNLWDYWLLSPEPFSGWGEANHFATFPSSIPRRAIQAGTSAYGCCAKCGAPYTRHQTRLSNGTRKEKDVGFPGNSQASGGCHWKPVQYAEQGWQPLCSCNESSCACPETVPATVLDPFAGSGTTGQVACEQLRHAVLIELNPSYCELIKRRLNSEQAKLFDGSNNGHQEPEAIQPLGTRQIELGI